MTKNDINKIILRTYWSENIGEYWHHIEKWHIFEKDCWINSSIDDLDIAFEKLAVTLKLNDNKEVTDNVLGFINQKIYDTSQINFLAK